MKSVTVFLLYSFNVHGSYHDVAYFISDISNLHTLSSQRRKWQPTPVFLLENPHGHRSLAATVHRSQRVGHDCTYVNILFLCICFLQLLYYFHYKFIVIIYYRYQYIYYRYQYCNDFLKLVSIKLWQHRIDYLCFLNFWLRKNLVWLRNWISSNT